MEMNRSISADSDWFALFVKQLSHLWMTSGLWPEIKSRFHSLYNREYFYIYVSNRNHSPFQQIYLQVKIEVFFFLTAFLLLLFKERLIPWPWNIIFLFDFLAKKIGSWRDDCSGWVSFIRKLFSFLSYLLRYRAYTGLSPELETLSQVFKI